jgi:hypothetical protein
LRYVLRHPFAKSASSCGTTVRCGYHSSAPSPTGRSQRTWIRSRSRAGSRKAARRRAFTPSSTQGCPRHAESPIVSLRAARSTLFSVDAKSPTDSVTMSATPFQIDRSFANHSRAPLRPLRGRGEEKD